MMNRCRVNSDTPQLPQVLTAMPNLKQTIKLLIFVVTLLTIIFVVAWLRPLPELPRHQPRDLPWTLPDFSRAKTQIEVLNDGRIHIQIEHLPLHNIEPKFISYFYKVLPISTVMINGQIIPMYHIFHPTEHGDIYVVEAAASGEKGMATGALIGRKEWFGTYNSEATGRILEMNSTLMIARPEMFGLHLGLITHTFEKTEWGTRYTLESFIGSELPIIGPLINSYIRNKMFPPTMITEWIRHQVQEVSSLQFFVRELYEQTPEDNQFILNI